MKITAMLMLLCAINIPAIGTEKDTMKVVVPEIRVEAGRINSLSGSKYSPVEIIDRRTIQESGVIQVNELLSSTPGLYIKNFGGTGGVKIVSLRGTTSQQSVYMLDGIRINTAQTGSVDLSVIPLFLLDAIEIVRGGASALYGGSSLGGVINFSTDKKRDKTAVNASASYGSFAEKSVSGGLTLPLGTWFAGTNFEYVGSEGDYPFQFNNFGETGTYYRKNADFSNIASMLTVGKDFENSRVKINLLSRFSDRGVPGPVVQNRIENLPDRLKESEFMASLNYSKSLESGGYCLSAAAKASGMNYKSPLMPGYLNENDFLEKYVYCNAKYFYTGFESISMEFMGEYTFNDIDYNYSDDVEDYKNRSAVSGAVRFETSDFTLPYDMQFSFQGALRYDIYLNSFSALSPVLSTQLSAFDGELRIRLQLSHNFRPPNFSELYYLNFGNRKLLPEKSNSLNAGFMWLPLDCFRLTADLFFIRTNDQIQSVPVSPVAWTASNFAEVSTEGIELSAETDFFERKLCINLNYTRQSALDRSQGSYDVKIPYVPNEMLNIIVQSSLGDLQLGADAGYSSFRYSLTDNSPGTVLPEYLLVNAFASYRFNPDNMRFLLRFDAINILDKQYQVVLNYPMPGIQFRFSLVFNFEQKN